MKAAMAAAPPYNGQWLYEVKFDGFRVLAIKNGKDVELWSRNEKRLDHRFPEIVRAVAKLAVKSAILDGEVCALDEKGRSSFQILQNSTESSHPVVYYVFDLLFEGSKDLRGLPLNERKTRLDAILLNTIDPILPSPSFSDNPQQVLDKMKALDTEGAIAKLKSSLYETGRRSGAWVKIKFHKGDPNRSLPTQNRKLPQGSHADLFKGLHRGHGFKFDEDLGVLRREERTT